MTFLDTVDGKLARVTLTSSRIGDVMDHGLDLIHPPFWCVGLGHRARRRATSSPPRSWWAAIWSAARSRAPSSRASASRRTRGVRSTALFRTITARRNPNLILLSVGAIAGRPDLGLVMVALWTIASLGFHALRLVQAEAERARGAVPVPWEEA